MVIAAVVMICVVLFTRDFYDFDFR